MDNDNNLVLCANCHNIISIEDKYCRYCGSGKGKEAFNPKDIEPEPPLYGPPIKVKHICIKCGHKWTEITIEDEMAVYCPKCGSKVDSESSLYNEWG